MPDFNRIQEGIRGVGTYFSYSVGVPNATPEEIQEILRKAAGDFRAGLEAHTRLRVEPEAKSVFDSFETIVDGDTGYQTFLAIDQANPGSVKVEQFDKEKYRAAQAIPVCEAAIQATIARLNQPI